MHRRAATSSTLVDDEVDGLRCAIYSGNTSSDRPIARTAALSAGLPETVPATTLDRQCGSSQQAVHFAAQAIMSGVQDLVVAGGVEVMSLGADRFPDDRR